MFDRRSELAKQITQYRNIFSNISEATTFLLQRTILVLNVTNLKYEKYDITSEKININKSTE